MVNILLGITKDYKRNNFLHCSQCDYDANNDAPFECRAFLKTKEDEWS